MNFNHFLNRIADINLSLDQKKRLFDITNEIAKENSISKEDVIQLIKDNTPEQDDFKEFIIQNFGVPIYINFKGIIGVNNKTGVLYKDSVRTITITSYDNSINQTINIDVTGNSNKNKWIYLGHIRNYYLFNFVKYIGSIQQYQERNFNQVYTHVFNGIAEMRNDVPIKIGDTMLVNGEIINCGEDGDHYSPVENYLYLGGDCLISDLNSTLIIKNPCYIETE